MSRPLVVPVLPAPPAEARMFVRRIARETFSEMLRMGKSMDEAVMAVYMTGMQHAVAAMKPEEPPSAIDASRGAGGEG